MKDKKFALEIEEVIKIGTAEADRLNSKLNLKLHDCSRDEGFIEYDFRVQEWELNPYGGVHGGAICTMFDTCMGIGAVALAHRKASTTDISVSYLRPLMSDRYIFRAEYTHVGRTMIRCTGKAIDPENGKICATCMASFAMSPEGFGKPQV